MSRIAVLSIFLLFPLICACAEGPALNLYVAPNGNDAWSGQLAEPNAAATDGPVASIAGARDAIRKIKGSGDLKQPVHVLIRAGVYSITEPIVFTPEDSGAQDFPITYEAFDKDQPVVSGGRVIKGWKQEGSFWTADIPEVRAGKWSFSALWVNGRRATPARTPNPTHPAGDYPEEKDLFYAVGPVMEKNPATGAEEKSATKFYYRPGDIQPWDSLKNATVVVYHSWETSLLHVKNLDEQNHIIEFTGPAQWPFGYWMNDQRYYIEHLFEALDQPGEWYLDSQKGKLYYIPMPGEDPATMEVVAPVAKQLILLEGKPAEGKFVSNLHFRGLRFFHSEYTIEPQGHCDGQAASGVPAAFQAVGARRCVISDCQIGHVATYGLWFRAGCQDNLAQRCEIFDLGAGAVRMGETSDPASENEIAQRNTVDNCVLNDGGRIFRGAVGVWIGRTSHNTISHNDISEFRYTGVSVGWSWGYAATSANHNLIEYDRIHDVGLGQLSDMGAIYTLGICPGTILRNNYIYNIISNPRVSGGWGIYFDEGTTDILAENNVVFNTATGGLHQHYGKENRVLNNIFAYSHGAQLVRSRDEDHLSFFFDRNIVYFSNDTLLGSTWANNKFEMNDNCYWSTNGDDFEFAGIDFNEWKTEGHDVRSIIADPLFVDINARDFRLKPESPARTLGFRPIDVSKAGLYGDAEWVEKQDKLVRQDRPFIPPAPPPPTTLSEDFEATPVGEKIKGAATLGEEGDAKIRVTDETAVSGKHSLKFTDAAGLQFAFNPHLVFSPHLTKGNVVGSFSVRVEPGAIFFHEWRDGKSPYNIGPSIWINASGDLTASGKTLLHVPPSQWIHIEINCPLGKDSAGTYTLVVTLPGQAPQRFENLPFASKKFHRLDWLGFVSNATAPTTFYVDDIKLAIP